MLAREIMTSPVVTAHPELSSKDAIRLLERHDITAVPVVDDRKRLIGIASATDLLPEHGDTIADVMTLGVLTAHESTDAAAVARLMLDTGVKDIPVVRGTQVVGIISRRDLVDQQQSCKGLSTLV
jgi:CBS domain-containing protein